MWPKKVNLSCVRSPPLFPSHTPRHAWRHNTHFRAHTRSESSEIARGEDHKAVWLECRRCFHHHERGISLGTTGNPKSFNKVSLIGYTCRCGEDGWENVCLCVSFNLFILFQELGNTLYGSAEAGPHAVLLDIQPPCSLSICLVNNKSPLSLWNHKFFQL